MCEKLGAKEISTQVSSNTDKTKGFWSKLLDNPAPYREDAEWLKEAELELENVKIQGDVEITKEGVTRQLRKIPNWKTQSLDGIQRFWIKMITGLYQRLTEQLNENMQFLSIPSWLVKRRTGITSKMSAKGNNVDNYRPIAS